MSLPPGYSSALEKYAKEFPKGTVLGKHTVVGNCAVVLEDGAICMRVEDEQGRRTWRTITGLRRLRGRHCSGGEEVRGVEADDEGIATGAVRETGPTAEDV